jgi:cytochrome c556
LCGFKSKEKETRMPSAKEIKTARKAVEKSLKTLNKVYGKLTGETPMASDSPKFRDQITTVQETVDQLKEDSSALGELLDASEESEEE